ncbi:MAG TPA: proton-conducting transporter membrane subunit [Chryseosolibacter sp.]
MEADIRVLILSPVAFTLVACLVIPFLPSPKKSTGGLFFVLLTAISTSVAALQVLAGETRGFSLPGGAIFGTISFQIDPLSAWFILAVNLTCLNAAWYGKQYLSSYQNDKSNVSLHWSLYTIFHTAMIMVCSIQNGFAFLLAWEIMSVTSTMLVLFDHNRFQTLNAGISYLVQMHIAVAFLMIGFIWAWTSSGSFSFDAISSFYHGPRASWLFAIFFTGFGIKAGFVPLHTWLPHAHPAAPSHISGAMSGIMAKMGIYGILRMCMYLVDDLPAAGAAILALSVITAFYGILSAAIHRDYKRVLAFSTIENIGIIGMGIGLGTIGKGIGNQSLMVLGFSAALLHLFNHSLYKSLLFFAAGNVYRFTHTRNMEHLGGLIKKIPATAFFFLCGAIAICGLPPFSGFISKFLLFKALLTGISGTNFQLNLLLLSSLIGLALVSGAALLTFGKTFSVIFLGTPRHKSLPSDHERFSFSHFPFFLIIVILLASGIAPALVLVPAEKIALTMSGGIHTADEMLAGITPAATRAGIASLVFVLMAGLVSLIRARFVSLRKVDAGPTWGCGYPAPGRRFQYTGKSFTKTLAGLFFFITSEEKKYTAIEPGSAFPVNRAYTSAYAEFFEKNVINRISNLLLNSLNYFTFIHNGRVQMYILYGLIFMLLIIVATFSQVI